MRLFSMVVVLFFMVLIIYFWLTQMDHLIDPESPTNINKVERQVENMEEKVDIYEQNLQDAQDKLNQAF